MNYLKSKLAVAVAVAAPTLALTVSLAAAQSLEGKVVARVSPTVQQVETTNLNAMRDALALEGIEFNVSSADGDSGRQRIMTEQLLTLGVDGMLFHAMDEEGWDETFKQAKEDGVIIISMAGVPMSHATTNLVLDNVAPGFEVGEYVGNRLKEKHNCVGSVGSMTTVNIPAFIGRTENAMTRIKEICPEVTIVAPVDAYTPSMGADAGGNLIQTHPELVAIVSVNDDAAVGAFTAITEAGKTDPDTFLLTGYDATPEGIKLMEDGTVFQYSWSYVIPYWGARGAQYIIAALRGEYVPKTARVKGFAVTAENLEDYKVWSQSPNDPANAHRFAEVIEESDVELFLGDPLSKAFE